MVLRNLCGALAAAVEPGSGEAQEEGGWVLKWMALYTMFVVMILHHTEHEKCRNHNMSVQMCGCGGPAGVLFH